MVIKKLILHRYKRFFLNNIETIEYTPNDVTQMIVSRNGSGKTSLLRQLNPLPADIKKDFNENGYKYIEIEHNNKLYTISSNFIPNKHSFKVDNVELNNGGTKTVNIELCKEHFNLDYSTMDILYGITNITTMSLPERKHWLSRLSTIDYTYPVSVYNKLRIRHRDIIGQLKGLKAELANINCKDNNVNKIKEKKELISMLHSIKDNILLSIGNKQINPIDINTNIDKLNTLLKQYKESSVIIEDIDTLNKKLNTTKENILKVDTILNKTLEELETLEKSVKVSNKEEIDTKYKEINNKINNILNTIDLPINNLDIIIDKLDILTNNIIPTIQNMLFKLDDYRHIRSIPTEDKKKAIEELNILYSKSKTYLEEYNVLTEELNTTDTKDTVVTCPNCNTNFNFSKYKHKLLKDRISVLTTNLDKIKTLIKEKEPIVLDINTYKQLHIDILDTINFLANKYLELKDLILYISNNIYNHIDTLDTINNKYTIYTNSVYKLKDLYLLYKERDTIKQQLTIATDLNKDKVLKEIDTKNKLVEKYTVEKRNYTTILNTLQESIAKVTIRDTIVDNIDKVLQDTYNNYNNNIDSIKQNYRIELLKYIKEVIVEQETSLQEMLDLNTKKDSIIKSIEDLTKREEVLKDMVLELSPTTGLIGKSINSFITILIEDINYIINKIWSYPIKLLPCNIDTKDLDYKFRVLVNDTDTIEDISRLSSSMQEIVNLAFKIILCKYLNLDVPLYLDEFGSTFDTTHRTTAYNIINTILSSEFKQLFIICHYESLYGSFKNADFNILDKDNVTIPEDVDNNRSLVIKYGE